MMEITVSEVTYNRLATLATGFETPDAVINRLIDACAINEAGEIGKPKKPVLFFNPGNETEFKKALLISKQARVELYKRDGTCEEGVWNARNLSERSSIRGNLWSGYLRNWDQKGIVRAVFTIIPSSN
ncbi:TPA: hypothetical protein U0A13_004973 [Escherichia coli]|nr:hypothetical protein [Escherichia coli]HEM0101806.1 hypothetical protein [Escherichia coli]HEM0849380.1 hypothetical protein [Escherichia coli]